MSLAISAIFKKYNLTEDQASAVQAKRKLNRKKRNKVKRRNYGHRAQWQRFCAFVDSRLSHQNRRG